MASKDTSNRGSELSLASANLQWSPLPMLAHGKIIRSFTPLDKHPSLKFSPFYKNLYYGDEVFLFETNNANWARGYQNVQPLPSDFISKSSDLEKLPEMQISVVIVPLSNVHITDRLPMSSSFAPPAPTDFENAQSSIPSIYDLQISNSKARNGELIDETANVRLKPPLPLVRLDSGKLLDELVPSLSQLASHIYSLYSVAEYALFTKLYKLFDELNDIRIKLVHNLLTKSEIDTARKKISLLLTNVSKLLSSKGVNRFEQGASTGQLKNDTSGYEAITSRDVHTGELYDYWATDIKKQPSPHLVAANQVTAALQPNFPVKNNLANEINSNRITKFDKVTPSQILVDFKDVSGSSYLNPKGFEGMTAYLYLRSAKKRLTEAFSIHIRTAADLSLDKISAALFRNIPGTEVDNGRIYLVAIITEEIEVQRKTPQSLKRIRKGLAAGVADISRIFSRHSGALESRQAHQFTINLFGSYVNRTDNTTLDPKNMNFGWGELLDRIIAGSKKGVAVNPRAEKLVVSIKEFRDDLANVAQDFDANVKTPIYQIRTNFFDPLVQAFDRIYLSLGKVNLYNNSTPFPGDLASISLVSENLKSKIGISKATNQIPGKFWDFTSVHSNEVVGEAIKLSNIEDIEPNETLKLKLYVNFEFKGEADVIVSQNGKIYEYRKNQMITFHNGSEAVGDVELTTDYIGKTYNIESAFQHILGWSRMYSLPEHEERLIETLKVLNQAQLQQDIKYFPEITVELLKIFNVSTELKLTKLKSATFYAFIHLLDVVIARQEQYTYLFHDFVDAHEDKGGLPGCGSDLIYMAASYFGKASTEWNYVGRTLCRILPLLVKTSLMSVSKDDVKEFKTAWKALAQTLASFVQIKTESNIPDILLVLEYLDLTVGHLRILFTASEIADYAIAVINAVGNRGLRSMVDDSGANSIATKEKQIFITKLLLVRRLLEGWIFDDVEPSEATHKLFYHAVNWAVEAYDSKNSDLDILRLANSCLVTLCAISWNICAEGREDNYALPRSTSRLLLTISRLFIKLHSHCRASKLFEAKRTYTQIFPNAYPFPELITDSTINDVIVVEILVELAVIYCYMMKIAKHIASSSQGYISIISSASDDDLFNQSPHYLKGFTKDDLLSVIQTNRLMIQSKFFPCEKWISLYALLIEGATSASELIKFSMIKDHIPAAADSEVFDRSLWSKYLKSLLAMAGSMPASICHLAEVPRKAAWKITQDIRTRCASVINQSWDCLGWDSLKRDYIRFEIKRTSGYHAEFIQDDYGILEELTIFCLQRNAFCQTVGVRVLWSIIIAELLVQETSDDPIPNKLIEVERGCLIGLDKFFKSNRYTPGLYEQRNFIKRLKMVARLDPEDESFPDVYNFIQNLSDFLDVQNDLTSVPGGEEFDDERTFHNLDILRHLMRVNNAKKFNSSLDDMYERNINKSNYVQAALCLELMSSTYNWNVHEMLPISIKPKFPTQSAFERKEQLYKMIAENLVKGNKFEKAVLIYKELADAYERVNFNLKGLGFVHGELSKLYKQLENSDRDTPTYFLVSFIGLGFPKTVRSRSFIYEGYPFEHINSIHNRLLRLHVGAKIISDEKEAQRSLESPPAGKFLYIITVKPQMDFANDHGNLSTADRLYMQNKDLKYFTTSRRLGKSSSVLDLWVEEITYETFNVFPTLMNRAEISEIHSMKLSPIQNALRTIGTKTQYLVNAESSAEKALKTGEAKSSAFNELSRNVSGTVDAPVNGGIGQYRAFFDHPPNPDDENAVQEHAMLKNAFDNLAICVYRCLLVHGKMVPDTLRDSHIALIRLFEKNFADEIKRTGLSVHELDAAAENDQLLRKVPSLSSISTATNSNGSGNSLNGSTVGHGTNANSRVSSMASVNTMSSSNLTRVDSTSSGKSQSTKATVTTNSSTGRKRSLLNWRQSRAGPE